MIRLDEIGAFASTACPGIEAQAGYEVWVRIIHKDDRFVPDIQTMNFPLTQISHSPNNLWQANLTLPITP